MKKRSKKVYFHFCGGCNVHYERRKYGEDFVKGIGGERTLHVAEADYVLLLNGCLCQCISGNDTSKLLSPFQSGKFIEVSELVKLVKGG